MLGRYAAFLRTVDISIVVDGRPEWSSTRNKKEEVHPQGGTRENGSKADGRVCLACGHLLPSAPGGWPCPSVFGERLSFDRRQTIQEERDLSPVGRVSFEEFEAAGNSGVHFLPSSRPDRLAKVSNRRSR